MIPKSGNRFSEKIMRRKENVGSAGRTADLILFRFVLEMF